MIPKIIDVNILNTYSCDNCQKWFKTKNEYKKLAQGVVKKEQLEPLFPVEKNIWFEPRNTFLILCSKGCEFKFIFKLVKRMHYNQKNYELILNLIGIKLKKGEFNENEAIFNITKYYNKIGLANIKVVAQGLSSNISGSKIVHNGSRAQANPLFIKRGLSPNLNQYLKEQELDKIKEEFNND